MLNDFLRLLWKSSSPIYVNLFCRFSIDMHGGAAFLLILLDVIAELHKRLISREAAFLKLLCPEKLFIYSIAEKFLVYILVIRHPL